MGSVQQIKVKWNHHQSNFPKVFENLLHKKEFVDVTLACEGQSVKAHKVVLSACSPYFHSLFVENPCQHPIVIMRDFKYSDIEAIVEYMYKGEVNIARESLREFLRTAQSLQVKGLADDDSNDMNSENVDKEAKSYPVPQSIVPEPEPEIRPSSRVSRPTVEHKESLYSHSQSSPAASREQFTPSAPKRMRVSERPAPLPPPPSIESTPMPSAVSYRSAPEVSQPTSVGSSSDVMEEANIKLEVKPFDVVEQTFVETHDAPIEESQEIDQNIDQGMDDSNDPDMIDLGDDPEIIDDEPEIMFSHDNTSMEGGFSEGDSLTSSLISAMREAGAGPSTGSPQQATGEGSRIVRKSSKVWDYFQEPDANDSRVICLVCGAQVARGGKGCGRWNSSNPVRHLRMFHQDLYAEMKLTSPLYHRFHQ